MKSRLRPDYNEWRVSDEESLLPKLEKEVARIQSRAKLQREEEKLQQNPPWN